MHWKPTSRLEWSQMVGSVALLLVLAVVLATADYSTHHSMGYDLIGLVFFTLSIFGLPALWFLGWSQRTVVALTIVAAYLGTYVLLSTTGDYWWSQSGKTRYSHGMAATDRLIWHPRGLYWEPFINVYGQPTSRGTLLGYFFMPLLRCDREWGHPSRRFPEDVPFE